VLELGTGFCTTYEQFLVSSNVNLAFRRGINLRSGGSCAVRRSYGRPVR
jgi:hypothetical protein